MVLFFNLNFGGGCCGWRPSLMLGALGFAAFARCWRRSPAASARVITAANPVVPLFVPALIAGVKASAAALAGAPLAAVAQWLKILVAFDVLFVTLVLSAV